MGVTHESTRGPVDGSGRLCPECEQTDETVDIWDEWDDFEAGRAPDRVGCRRCDIEVEFQ